MLSANTSVSLWSTNLPFDLLYIPKGGPKVYDVSKYLDDHPGGAEVMLDVAGKDADEFFEDIGHSKEARLELTKYYIGEFKLDEKALAALRAEAERKKHASGPGAGLVMVLLVAFIAVLFGVYSQMFFGVHSKMK
jgi:cytochrome b involved in lipid metabolism